MDEIPRVLAGRYEVGELIGRGGMAEVHIGYDNRLSRTVAIKVLRSDLARDATFQARFRREAQSSAALNHPSIVAVYDTGEEQVATPSGQHITVPFIVMEYVEGHTVRSLISGGDPVPIEEAVEIVVGVLSALEYSHREGIVHRDIKPGNIMLTPTGQVKVMDFGIARAMTDSAATMTQTHAVVGTAQYLSPEQARGEVVDARSDLYSTGCLLYELLTGQPPFTGDSALAVAYQHVGETPKTPSSVAPDIPEVLDRVVLKALAKDRNDRYSDAAHMRADLLAAVRGGRVEAPATAVWGVAGAAAGATAVTAPLAAAEATRTMSPATTATRTGAPVGDDDDDGPRRSRWWVWLLALLGVAAAVGIVALVLDQNDEPPPPEMVAVPDLTGLDQVGAREELEDVGLVPSIVDDVPSDTVEAGVFVESNPPVGTEVEVGETVEIAFSSGPEAVEVPNVVGMTQEQAASALEDVGLASGSVDEVNDPSAGPGDVVATDPAAGASAAPGSRVNLTVASNLADLPDLTGQTEEEASAALAGLDLNARITQEESADAAPGTVIRQSHPAGVVERGTTVTLTIAVAPEPTPEPTTAEPTQEPTDEQPTEEPPTDEQPTDGGGNG
ncbi:Stk1 family PASTA domain-containing Ser/Thr kinase [Georgenia sp. EYE_87]|uniref:Stk1 family PASTA domain-containing Ser/Thr kinase n=1 Tax=Georgenia sp. EYE_87 TaxID=2853448 RepID=UPI0020041755|nr:Stk1 family PASTA domain-containing Ser/Thr kinase [Georgenia sp. EYE_87]MCK6210354.1 Stk1 family PASTA domain-containing Ser/Thr kinase [Georgenia sp. EYE_87]